MKKKVLLFHISDAEERKKILKVLLPLKVVVESVGKQDYTQSLDFLSGNKQASKTDEECSGRTGRKNDAVLRHVRRITGSGLSSP